MRTAPNQNQGWAAQPHPGTQMQWQQQQQQPSGNFRPPMMQHHPSVSNPPQLVGGARMENLPQPLFQNDSGPVQTSVKPGMPPIQNSQPSQPPRPQPNAGPGANHAPSQSTAYQQSNPATYSQATLPASSHAAPQYGMQNGQMGGALPPPPGQASSGAAGPPRYQQPGQMPSNAYQNQPTSQSQYPSLPPPPSMPSAAGPRPNSAAQYQQHTAPQPPTSMHQPPSSMQQPPSSMHQPPSSMHQPPSSMQQPPRPYQQPPAAYQQPPGPYQQPPGPYQQPPGPYQQQQRMPPPPSGPGGMGSMGPQQPVYPGSMGHPPAQPQQPQSRTLDPDQMPSAVQVMEEDRKKNSGQFETGQRGQAPPLVTTDFVAIDQGNCSPRFMRSTVYSVPCTADMLKATQIPFGLVVSPMAEREDGEQPLYISDLGACGPVRCIRCKAYMSPYMTWIDGGRRFQCALCGGSTDTPETYFAHLDHTGRRVDTYQRPELHLGSYEMLATTDYCKGGQLPNTPGIVFMIDVSYRAVKCGLTRLICANIKNQILSFALPKEDGVPEGDPSPLRVGFVTYDRVIHYYNLSPTLSQPQMMIVTDLEDVFVPLVDGFLVDAVESEAQIDQLLDSIPQLFEDTKETETILGPVIESGVDAFKSAQCPGKLIVFHTGLPTAEAPGKLRNRDDRKLLGTDKEKTILTPQSSYYTDLGQRCVEAGVGVDLFVCCDSYVDLASIGQVPFMSGGSMYKYTYFQSVTQGQQLMRDLEVAVRGTAAFDCVMRIRTSAGTRPVDFFGGMYMVNTTDVEMGVFECDKAVALEIKHDDKLTEGEPVIVQCALLYTSVSGQRRLRIHNLALSSTNQMADTFRSAELDTIVNLLSKMSLKTLLKRNPKDVRESLINRCSGILAAYRKNCATNSGPGQLILPEAMKLLPLYTNAIIKSDALQGGPDVSTDDRSYLMYLTLVMNVTASNVFFYPRLTPLHEISGEDESAGTPAFIRCSVERLAQKGVYLLDNGLVMFLWIGPGVDPQWINQVFGVSSLAEIRPDMTELPELDNSMSHRIRQVIADVRQSRKRHLRLHVVRARDKLEPWFLNFLVEDRGTSNGSTSYVDFLLHIHKEIRSLLN